MSWCHGFKVKIKIITLKNISNSVCIIFNLGHMQSELIRSQVNPTRKIARERSSCFLQGRPLSSPLQKQPFKPAKKIQDICTKGQWISKAIYGPKKRTKLTILSKENTQDSEFRSSFGKNLALHYVQNVSILWFLVKIRSTNAILAQTSVTYKP